VIKNEGFMESAWLVLQKAKALWLRQSITTSCLVTGEEVGMCEI